MIKNKTRHLKKHEGYGKRIYRQKKSNRTFFYVVAFLVMADIVFWSSLPRDTSWLEEKEDNTGKKEIIEYKLTSNQDVEENRRSGIINDIKSPDIGGKEMNPSIDTNVIEFSYRYRENQEKEDSVDLEREAENRYNDEETGKLYDGEAEVPTSYGCEQNMVNPNSYNELRRKIKEDVMQYNVEHLEDPMRGYPLTPRSVSLTYKIKEVKASMGNLPKELEESEAALKIIGEREKVSKVKDARIRHLQNRINQLKKAMNSKQNEISRLKSELIREYEKAVDSPYFVGPSPGSPVLYRNTCQENTNRSKPHMKRVSPNNAIKNEKPVESPKTRVNANTTTYSHSKRRGIDTTKTSQPRSYAKTQIGSLGGKTNRHQQRIRQKSISSSSIAKPANVNRTPQGIKKPQVRTNTYRHGMKPLKRQK